MEKYQFCHLTTSTAFFLVSAVLLFSLPVNKGFYDAIVIDAGNLGGPIDPYTGLSYYGTGNFHWWLNNPYRMAGIPTGVSHDYRQTIACGAGPLKTYSFDTHRIVGGVDATKNAWPGIVGLRFGGQLFCGGSLITPTKILTAAHCLTGIKTAIPNLTVDLGMHVQSPSDAQLTKNVRKIAIHWAYNAMTHDNDIAIITLSSPVTYTSTISPVCLANSNDQFADQEAAIIGWGTKSEGGSTSSVLQQATVKITTNAQCKTSYATLASSMLCAAAPGKDTCQGDSGGPLLVRSAPGSPWIQAGIVSFGVGCARPEYPGVYTRVSSYGMWIWLHTLF